MAKFAYEAKNATGVLVKGEIDGGNEAEARVKLRSQRLVPIRLVVMADKKALALARRHTKGRVKAKDLQIFTRQLSTLLASGIPILQSIDVLGKGTGGKSTVLTSALHAIVAEVSKGKRLGDSLAEHPNVFDKFYVNMVRAGEESGNLDAVLQRLAVYIEKSVKIQGKIKGALVYPGAIMFVAGVVVSALLVFVIPKFQDLFANSGQELPQLTQMVVGLSKVFINYWYLIFGGLGGGFFLISNYYRTDAGKAQFDRILIDIPLIGDLIQKGGIARFSRTLSTLLESGVGITESLDIAARVVGNVVIEGCIIRAKEAIMEGRSLIVPLSKEKYIPGMVTQMIGVGEQTGNLDQMLGKIADFYEDEVDGAVSALTSMMEPILMVFLGGIIAVIVIAMYLPIFNMASGVG